MHHHHRVAISTLLIIIVLSGIFISTHLTEKNREEPIIEIPFGGLIPLEITHGDTTKKQVIFTFDGGEGNQSALTILDILRKHNIKGTFFLTGKWILKNPDFVKKMIDGGHEIFNHTFDHPYLTQISNEQIISQFNSTEQILINLVGTSSKPYFRAPYGDRNVKVIDTAANLGYRSVYWTIDARDWLENEGETALQVKNRILLTIAPGNIYLMHLGDNITGSILDDVFTQIEYSGYKIVSLSEGI